MRPLDASTLALAGTTVIEASAGTGKTYTITSLFLRLLLEHGLRVDQILVVTYTRAATAELRDRIRGRLATALRASLGERVDDEFVASLCAATAGRGGGAALCATLERALAGVDEAPVLTIHGFCQRVLSEHAFESRAGLSMQLTPHAAPLLAEITDDYFTKELYAGEPERVRALLDEPNALRKLAPRAAAAGGLRVVPEQTSQSAFDRAAWQSAYTRCQRIWREDRERIVTLFASLPTNRQYAVKWPEQMDSLLTEAQPGATLGGFKAGFFRFTRSGVLDRLKAKPGLGAPSHPFFDAAQELRELDEAHARARKDEKLVFRRGFVDYVQRELGQRSRAREVRTFDALLSDLDAALAETQGEALAGALRQRYRAALVDEFQDTDPLQYRIFRRVFGEAGLPLLLIGDPKQAIYGFRGADVRAYLVARRDAGERVFTLDTNRRSDPSMIEALNRLYASVISPFALEDIAYHPVRAPGSASERFRPRDRRAPLDLAFLAGEGSLEQLRRTVARRVAADIAGLLGSGAEILAGEPGRPARFRGLAASDVAVLCRTNRQARDVQLALSQLGVASVFQGDESVFESDDAAELERALLCMAHPGDAQALRSFLCSWYGGHDAHELARLEADDAAWDRQRETVQSLHETWLAHGLMPAVRALVAAFDVERRLLMRPDGTRRITNLWHLCELLAEAAISERLGPLGLLRWFALVRSDQAQRAELVGESHELRLESGDNAVKLTTIHKSKGLEYPIVYCPFSWDSAALKADDKQFVRFHDPMADHALTLDLGSDDQAEHASIAEGESLAEALRLLYVALTRAKHRVCLVVPKTKSLVSSALAYTLWGGSSADALKARFESIDVNSLLREFEARAGQSQGTLSARLLENAGKPAPRWGVTESSEKLEARPVRRSLEDARRVSSFSGLVARERTTLFDPSIDHDAVAVIREEAEIDAPPANLALEGFPAGAAAGQLAHEVLEELDFAASLDGYRRASEAVLAARAYAPELAEALASGLFRAAQTPLDEGGLCLAQIPMAARLNELEFVFPVRANLTPRTLERVFRAHRAPASHPSYANELKQLGFDALRGHLRGFIDLVFAHEGRFYVVDYKTNRLGPRVEDYAQASLTQSMVEHHYFLQAHLYGLAVHRYLGLRLPGYDYDQHFGGVYYLFLRGMAPEHPLRTGVLFDRPPRALIEELDAALDAAEPQGEAS